MTLREVLHAHIPTLTVRSTVRDAVDKMDVYQFPALVIVDDDMGPIGVLTEGDLARAVGQHGSLSALKDQSAFEFATREPTTAPPSLEVSEALHQMLSQGITVLPIQEDSVLHGLVLRVDLMQAMLIDTEPGP
ncbi:MAG: CBS domain-containing protein [Armatimonadetes bacterium]|nr:CBS domain-containing protein [Armatimonadota bacterium]